jgi:hypothetical protein
MVSVSNIHKDPDEKYGHGEGDDLTVLVHGDTTARADPVFDSSFARAALFENRFTVCEQARPVYCGAVLKAQRKFWLITREAYGRC